jgi:hypothetical protein
MMAAARLMGPGGFFVSSYRRGHGNDRRIICICRIGAGYFGGRLKGYAVEQIADMLAAEVRARVPVFEIRQGRIILADPGAAPCLSY